MFNHIILTPLPIASKHRNHSGYVFSRSVHLTTNILESHSCDFSVTPIMCSNIFIVEIRQRNENLLKHRPMIWLPILKNFQTDFAKPVQIVKRVNRKKRISETVDSTQHKKNRDWNLGTRNVNYSNSRNLQNKRN